MIVDVVVPFYADVERIQPTLDAIIAQRLGQGHVLHVIVVDDGTPDDGASSSMLRARYPSVQVLRLGTNLGRSEACNEGVAAGSGDVVLILDNDCVLQGRGVVEGHIALLEDCDVSIGAVVPGATGVWGELGRRAADRRGEQAAADNLALLTTQHLAIKRSAFATVGGFSTEYRQYGFEDRDLLGRLADAGMVLAFADELVAVEYDQPELAGYLRKARMAGRHTAATFRNDHPDLYAKMPYQRFDVGLRNWLRPVALVARVLLPAGVAIGGRAIDWPILPMGFRVFVVRALFAASFMSGTAEETD